MMMMLGAKSHDPQGRRGRTCVRNGAAGRASPRGGEGGRGKEEEGEGGGGEDEEEDKEGEEEEGAEAWVGKNRAWDLFAAAETYVYCSCLLLG